MTKSLQRKASTGRRVAVLVAAITTTAILAGTSVVVLSYDVAAIRPHSATFERLLKRMMHASVRAQARTVSVPRDLDLRDPALAERAIGHYSVACAPCHAAPGESAAPWMFLYPPPPKLTELAAVQQWSDPQLYWIIKNGIKDTGMIALGPTHSEAELWAVSAFVRQLPTMSQERYRALRDDHEKRRLGMQTAREPAHH